MRSLPPGVPLVIYSPLEQKPAIWDPVTISYSGLKLKNPIQSIPIYIHSQNACWQDTVEMLVQNASAIVIDLSYPSESLSRELEFIAFHDKQESTVYLRDGSIPGESLGIEEPQAVQQLQYQRIHHRLPVKFVFGLLFFIAITAYPNAFLADRLILGLQSTTINIFLLVLTSLYLVLFSYQPTIDKNAKRQLKKILDSLVNG